MASWLGHKGVLDDSGCPYGANQVLYSYGLTAFSVVGYSLHCLRVRGPNLLEQARAK